RAAQIFHPAPFSAGKRKKVSKIRRKVGGAARSIDLHCFPCDRSHRRARHAAHERTAEQAGQETMGMETPT
ncbi:hypothetical protein, partial [Burkholderia stabilis]